MEKNHTIGEDLIKPSITAFHKTVLQKDYYAINAMPLKNNTVSKRIDELSEDILLFHGCHVLWKLAL